MQAHTAERKHGRVWLARLERTRCSMCCNTGNARLQCLHSVSNKAVNRRDKSRGTATFAARLQRKQKARGAVRARRQPSSTRRSLPVHAANKLLSSCPFRTRSGNAAHWHRFRAAVDFRFYSDGRGLGQGVGASHSSSPSQQRPTEHLHSLPPRMTNTLLSLFIAALVTCLCARSHGMTPASDDDVLY